MFKFSARLVIQLAAVAALLVTAWSGSVTSASSKKVLTVAVWSNWNFVQTAANAYMKTHKNVQINISAIPGEQYFTSLPRTLPNGGADITVLEVTGTGSYQALAHEHALVNLRGTWDKMHLDKVTPKAVTKSYTSGGGARYAVNIDETILPLVYYNKSLFKKLKIKDPKGHRVSLSQFQAISNKLKASGHIAATSAWTTDSHHIFQQYLLSSCGKTMYYKLAKSWKKNGPKVKWTSPCVVRGLAAERALTKKGDFGANPLIGYDVASADFLAQKSGMFMTGMWAVPSLQTGAKFKWDWFLMPPPPGGRPTNWLLYSADGLGVNSHSKNRTLAENFLSTMMTRGFQSSLLTQGRPPSRTDISVPRNASPQLVAMVKSEKTLGTATHFIGILAPADFQNTVVTGTQEMILGTLSPAGLAKQLQTLAVKLRKS